MIARDLRAARLDVARGPREVAERRNHAAFTPVGARYDR